jgi:GNAT superfamily N-acetyltransferase
MTLPADVQIRRAVPEDAEALARLHVDCWDDAYTGLMPQEILDARRDDVPARVERWRKILATGHTTVAEHEASLIGFVNAAPGALVPGFEIQLFALYVRAAWWDTGVGSALFAKAVGDRSAYLWVLEGNDRAIRFYERKGFRLDGTGQDEDEGRHLRMVREVVRAPSAGRTEPGREGITKPVRRPAPHPGHMAVGSDQDGGGGGDGADDR